MGRDRIMQNTRVPCSGSHPIPNQEKAATTHIAHEPPHLAVLRRTNIHVQEQIVDAALHGNGDAVFHALMLDPLTAAVCSCRRAPRFDSISNSSYNGYVFVRAGAFLALALS